MCFYCMHCSEYCNFIPMYLTDAVNGFSALGQLKSGKEIACVFEFDDGNHPLIAYLDENFFHCEQENFVGQAYLLCKVIRKTPKG